MGKGGIRSFVLASSPLLFSCSWTLRFDLWLLLDSLTRFVGGFHGTHPLLRLAVDTKHTTEYSAKYKQLSHYLDQKTKTLQRVRGINIPRNAPIPNRLVALAIAFFYQGRCQLSPRTNRPHVTYLPTSYLLTYLSRAVSQVDVAQPSGEFLPDSFYSRSFFSSRRRLTDCLFTRLCLPAWLSSLYVYSK